MTVEEKYKEELEKIVFLKDVNRREFGFSSILLFREYQSRLYEWKAALGFNGLDLFKKKVFHNLFTDLAPGWINDLISEERVINDLNHLGFNDLHFSFRDFNGLFISMFLNWEIFKDSPELRAYSGLPHPYDPVFKVISRGGNIFYVENGLVIDDGQTYRKHDNNFRLPSMDEDFLTYVDQNCYEFPNQARVNELWAIFQNINSRSR